MAQSARFSLSLRILLHLAREPEQNHTSAALADALGTGPVVVRRLFAVLHRAGFLVGRKGPSGGVRLRQAPKEIRLGDLYAATEPDWLATSGAALDRALARSRREALEAMNETTLATILKRLRKAAEADKA